MTRPNTPESPGLQELLRPEGIERESGGNQPIRLDSAQRAWLVVAGKVEIFAVRTPERDDKGKEQEGPRTHLATAEDGQLLLGIDPGRPGTVLSRDRARERSAAVLLVVPHPGTRLLEIEAATLTRLAREPDHLPVLAAAIEAWVTRLFCSVPRKAAPKHFEELRPGAEVRLDEPDQVARTAEGVVWVRHISGRSRFLGHPELVLEPAPYLLPITDDTWLASIDETTALSCVATSHLLKSGTLWEGLGRFHQLVLQYVALRVAAAQEEEWHRLEHRLELDTETLKSAYARLASILGAREPGRLAVGEISDPYLAACRLVGQYQGLRFRSPPGSELPATSQARIHRISGASRVRLRRVLLRDDWWKCDNGPLLAFLKEEDPAEEGPARETRSQTTGETPRPRPLRRPVALLPTTPTSYELVDPVHEIRLQVDAGVAASLEADAFMFYPVLPERKVGVKDLLALILHGRRRDLLMILMIGMGGGLLALAVPVVTEQLFGHVIPGADRGQLLWMILALVVAAMGAAAFQVTRSIAVLRITGKSDGSLQAAVWDRLLSLPSAFFRRFTVGDLTSRAMGIDAIRKLLLGNVTTSFLSLVFSVFSFGLLFYYSWKMALLASALIGLLLGTSLLLAWIQLRYQRELLHIEGKIASKLFGLIRGLSKLRISGGEKRAFAQWAEHFHAQRSRAFQARTVANWQGTFNSVFGIGSLAALFAMSGLTLEDGLPVSRFLAFITAFGQVQSAALTFVSLLSGLLGIVPNYERLRPILDEVPEVDESKLEAGELSGDVEFNHVSFRYHDDGPLILNDVTFRARPGEFVALVGPSGSGKSTALRLLLGFEQPRSGSIYYDGQDLASLDLQSVRRQIGVVLQNSRPMAGDIFSNIRGNSGLGIDAAWEAARMAGIEDDIKAMPMGMHTIISEGAATFSGGQLQRLLIARAIINRPRMVFFDEATSALDNRTQEIVSQSLERLKATRIVIAHRLSTIRNADRIYVIEKGRMVEEGAYEDLVDNAGLFARLVERQSI